MDSGLLAEVLGLKRRRAQQILAPLVGRTVGRSSLVPKDAVIRHLRSLVSGVTLSKLKSNAAPGCMLTWQMPGPPRFSRKSVAAPAAIVRQELENLPAGVTLVPGRIVLEGFTTIEEAQEKILALIMALGQRSGGLCGTDHRALIEFCLTARTML